MEGGIDQTAPKWHLWEMQWTSCISRRDSTTEALEECLDQIQSAFAPDLVLVFASRHHTARSADIPRAVKDRFPGAVVAGCSSWSVIGGGEEIEDGPGLSVTAAKLPGVELDARHVARLDSLEGYGADVAAFLAVVDSNSTDTDALVERLDELYPEAVKFGGFASGGLYPGSNVLFHGRDAVRQGSVVVGFRGDLAVDTVVAQGCKPIGAPLIVMRHQDNVILELDQGKPAEVLQRMYASLPPEDQRLIPQALNLGIEMRAQRDGVYQRGDYLVRPIMGIDPNSGALVVSEKVPNHAVVQFHLRDAKASTADLQEWLGEFGAAENHRGALLFSCIGRGAGLFGVSNHDTGMFREMVGDLPIGGFFCSGEIGPVGDRTFVHGYTSTFAVFRPRGDE